MKKWIAPLIWIGTPILTIVITCTVILIQKHNYEPMSKERLEAMHKRQSPEMVKQIRKSKQIMYKIDSMTYMPEVREIRAMSDSMLVKYLSIYCEMHKAVE